MSLIATRLQFQSTHPHGVRHKEAKLYQNAVKFQSTHPHGVRQMKKLLANVDIAVSIHAPARGATQQDHGRLRVRVVSIHAPARGATWFGVDDLFGLDGFNPRTRTGCDQYKRFAVVYVNSFNPRTRTGCDFPILLSATRRACFNPRTRTGCDLKNVRDEIFYIERFNPRTRTGCDFWARPSFYLR